MEGTNIAAAIVAALFAIAAPLGDSHHGLGKHNHTVADLGNVVFGAFLIGVVVLVLLIVIALIQYALRPGAQRATQRANDTSDTPTKSARAGITLPRSGCS